MKIEVAAVEQSTCDTTGRVAALGLQTRQGDRHMLVIDFSQAQKLIAQLASAGALASVARGTEGMPPDGREQAFLVRATFAAAGMSPTGGAQLILRFGELSLTADLDPSTARRLAEELQQAAAPTAARTQ